MKVSPEISQLYLYIEDNEKKTVQLIEDLSDIEFYKYRFLIMDGDKFGQAFTAEKRKNYPFGYPGEWKLREI